MKTHILFFDLFLSSCPKGAQVGLAVLTQPVNLTQTQHEITGLGFRLNELWVDLFTDTIINGLTGQLANPFTTHLVIGSPTNLFMTHQPG
jgi:hypothetical protein